MSTHIIEIQPKSGYVWREEIQHQDVYVALQIAKQRYPDANYISCVGTKEQSQTWTPPRKEYKEEYTAPVNSGSSAPSSVSSGGLLLVGGAFALYFAALYAPFLCAGGSAILAFKFTKPKHESKLLKTKLRWRLLAAIVAAGIGAFGGDQIQRQLEVGPYQNTISQLTQK